MTELRGDLARSADACVTKAAGCTATIVAGQTVIRVHHPGGVARALACIWILAYGFASAAAAILIVLFAWSIRGQTAGVGNARGTLVLILAASLTAMWLIGTAIDVGRTILAVFGEREIAIGVGESHVIRRVGPIQTRQRFVCTPESPVIMRKRRSLGRGRAERFDVYISADRTVKIGTFWDRSRAEWLVSTLEAAISRSGTESH